MTLKLDPERAEQEATQFALDLLMPKQFVKDWVAKHFPSGLDLADDYAIDKFCQAFQVDPAVASARLLQLGYGNMM